MTPKNDRMPAYDKLSPESLNALVEYLTSLKEAAGQPRVAGKERPGPLEPGLSM